MDSIFRALSLPRSSILVLLPLKFKPPTFIRYAVPSIQSLLQLENLSPQCRPNPTCDRLKAMIQSCSTLCAAAMLTVNSSALLIYPRNTISRIDVTPRVPLLDPLIICDVFYPTVSRSLAFIVCFVVQYLQRYSTFAPRRSTPSHRRWIRNPRPILPLKPSHIRFIY